VRGQIGAFAQDGSRIAWVSSSPLCREFVQLRNLASGKQSALATKRGATCRNWIRKDVSPMLALAGTRALWGLYQTSLSHKLLTLVVGGIGRRDRIVEELESDCDDCRGAPAVSTAGDGSTLLYLGFGITRVLGARIAKVPHARPIAFLSLAGTSVAYARYLGTDYSADARWSPTGTKLAFTSGRDYGNPSLHVVRPTGKGLENFTGSSEAVTPAWSPDGATLAYVGPGGATWALWTIDPATRARRKVASDVVAGFRPAWSPNGYTLAFTRPEASEYRIYTVGADGRGERPVAAGDNPQWSPDGSRLVFSSAQGISVANADGTGKALLAAGGHTPSFSPDGTRIAFERAADIWVMNADGASPRRLTDDHDAQLPRWSPGGTRIAFERGHARQPYVINTDGSGERRLAAVAAQGDLDWSPDAARIVFAGKGGLYVAQANAPGVRRIAVRPETRIEIRHVRTGHLQQTLVADGRARAIALSRSIVAVLTDKRLSIYSRASGTRLATRAVPRTAAPLLSAAGRNVVFRVGRTIWLLSGRRLRRLAVARAKPIGLSIEGNRVAWAENLSGRARIRAVFLR
jgi:TolB protein